jgi:hypothetical protein
MSKNNIILAVAIIVLLSGIAWYFWGGSSTNTNNSLVSASKTSSVVAVADGKKILDTLNKAESITLNTSFLNTQAYKSLRESQIQIINQTVGRSNPFSPLSSVNRFATTSVGVVR